MQSLWGCKAVVAQCRTQTESCRQIQRQTASCCGNRVGILHRVKTGMTLGLCAAAGSPANCISSLDVTTCVKVSGLWHMQARNQPVAGVPSPASIHHCSKGICKAAVANVGRCKQHGVHTDLAPVPLEVGLCGMRMSRNDSCRVGHRTRDLYIQLRCICLQPWQETSIMVVS